MTDALYPSEAIEIVDGSDVARLLTIDHLQRFTHNHVEGIFSATRSEEVEQAREETRARISLSIVDMATTGDLSVLRVNGEIAAMAGIGRAGRLSNGRDVYEIKRVSVLPAFRGRKFASILMDHLMRKLSESHPTSVVLVHTKEERIRNWAFEYGFTQGTLQDALRIWEPDTDVEADAIHEWLDQETAEGWGAYLYDLQKK